MEGLERRSVSAIARRLIHQKPGSEGERRWIRIRDAEHPDGEAPGVSNLEAKLEWSTLVEDDRGAAAGRRLHRPVGEPVRVAEGERLVAIDPHDGSDREPDHRERDHGQDQAAWTPGSEERE